ncbi:hypothetical protein BDZ94DRAFT_1265540 [Collybia nuda]|uniref:Uncharacterized protein n=1 Tax=Collybia nuda TaxID=64659 RepID=A0A9P6CFX4_9AGAR|nr:hypothetical protein BDZ94DRAFT_1265540 [Collybia nuda]
MTRLVLQDCGRKGILEKFAVNSHVTLRVSIGSCAIPCFAILQLSFMWMASLRGGIYFPTFTFGFSSFADEPGSCTQELDR